MHSAQEEITALVLYQGPTYLLPDRPAICGTRYVAGLLVPTSAVLHLLPLACLGATDDSSAPVAQACVAHPLSDIHEKIEDITRFLGSRGTHSMGVPHACVAVGVSVDSQVPHLTGSAGTLESLYATCFFSLVVFCLSKYRLWVLWHLAATGLR